MAATEWGKPILEKEKEEEPEGKAPKAEQARAATLQVAQTCRAGKRITARDTQVDITALQTVADAARARLWFQQVLTRSPPSSASTPRACA